jgi:hypothetical protein
VSDLDAARQALADGRPAAADRLASAVEADAFLRRDFARLAAAWSILPEARRLRRQQANSGRIDLHTHTTASDGEMTVEQSLCEHFRRGQILINDHNIIDSLAEARRLVCERDLELDVFLGIEVICTRERRAFEFMAIAPTLSPEFARVCGEHRRRWNRACELFVDELVARDELFSDPLWRSIAEDHALGGDFSVVIERYRQVRDRIAADAAAREVYLRRNQTFDMGSLWRDWGLAVAGDPPMLNHRFFGSMRCYAMNAYRAELGDWFDYDRLAGDFRKCGCLISHNHPNYWDEDFIGELSHQLQTEWIRDWAARGVIDALEVWSPPFASRRVPHYWREVCEELRLIPMCGTDCHSGREQEYGGAVEDHPEIPPQIYEKLAAPSAARAKLSPPGWQRFAAWREVLDADYAHEEALRQCAEFARTHASSASMQQ